MPRNARPGGIFGDMDYGWKGTTLNERIQAQNVWDLLEAQEKSNQLAEQRLEQEKENAKLMANATKQAERERFNNQLYLEELREDQATKERQLRLCDDIGVDLQDLQEFYAIINDIDISPTNDISSKIVEVEKQIDSINKKLQYCEENKPCEENVIYHENKEINYCNREIERNNKKLAQKSLILRIFSFKLRAKINQLKEDKIETEQKIKIKLKNFNENKDKLISEHNNRVHNLESQLPDLQNKLNQYKTEHNKILDKIKQDKYKQIMDFNNFRSNHYNDEIEMVFRKLHMKFPLVDIKKEGTIKDYNRYIRKIIESE